MTNQTYLDPMTAAMDPQMPEFSKDFWGQVQLNVWSCALVKGTGKIPYDPNVHERAWTAIDLAILPIGEMNLTNPKITERDLLAESKEWVNITLASLKELGITDLRQIIDRWAKVEAVPTGETYENKNGQTREKTQFRFVAFFDSEQACKDDYYRHNLNAGSNSSTAAPQAQAAPTNGGGKEKETALAFARVIVENACKGQSDLNAIRTNVSTNMAMHPLISKHFTVDSPEIAALMMETMMKK